MSRSRKVAASLMLSLLASACSRSDPPSVLGHWRAERVSVYSVQLPVGPEIVISKTAIVSPETGASIPVQNIERKGEAATIDMPLGIGLKFYFDGPDRMYLQVPLIGKVYYRRVADPAAAADGAQEKKPADLSKPSGSVQRIAAAVREPLPVPADQSAQPGDGSTEAFGNESTSSPQRAVEASSTGGESKSDAGSAEYRLALTAANAGYVEAALDHLRKSFGSGFKAFDKLDQAPEMDKLRNDVRYQALVAHYR